MQVGLYAEFAPEELMPFLVSSQSYALGEAFELCAAAGLVREQVLLLHGFPVDDTFHALFLYCICLYTVCTSGLPLCRLQQGCSNSLSLACRPPVLLSCRSSTLQGLHFT